jgi:hypothetical protein
MIQQQCNCANHKAVNPYRTGLNAALSGALGAALGSNTESAATQPEKSHKRHTYNLLRTASKYLRDYRVSSCQKVPVGITGADGKYSESEVVSVGKFDDGGAKFSGLSYCGSIWLCPVCAKVVAPSRVNEVYTAMSKNAKSGGQSLFVTFTQPHFAIDSLKSLIQIQSKALSGLKSDRRYKEAVKKYGFIGEIRAFEITHTSNGWHPHIHAIYLFDNISVNKHVDEFRNVISDLWRKYVVKHGGRMPSDVHGVDVKLPRKGDEDEIASYVAKWGMELTLNHTKRGKNESSRTPFQILDDLHTQYTYKDHALIMEYAEATFKRRRLFWSPKLKEYFGIDEIDDQELAEKPAPKHLFDLTWRDYKKIRECRFEGDLLDIAERYPVNVCQSIVTELCRIYDDFTDRWRVDTQNERRKRRELIKAQTAQFLHQNNIRI